MERVTDFIFLVSKITVDGECSHEIKRHLLHGRKAMTNLESESVSRSVMDSLRPVNCSLPSSSVHGIFQARVLEWVAIPFSRGSSRPRDRTQVSCIAGRLRLRVPERIQCLLTLTKILLMKKLYAAYL